MQTATGTYRASFVGYDADTGFGLVRADSARGLKPGDIILAVGKERVSGVGDFYRRLWSTGAAGVSVILRVLQGDSIRELTVKTMDRSGSLKLHPPMPGSVPAGPAVWLRE